MREVVLNTNKDNINEIQSFLIGFDVAINIYDGDYTADWLLSDIYSNEWVLKTNKTVKHKSEVVKHFNTPQLSSFF